MGRKPIGERAMTSTERGRRRRERLDLVARCRARHERRQRRKAGVAVTGPWFAWDGDFEMEFPEEARPG